MEWRPASPQPGRERLALEILHDEIVNGAVSVRGRADVVDGADVRMIEGRDDARFALEPLAKLQVGRQLRGENLQRDVAIEPHVARPIDLTHSPFANPGLDFVRPEPGTGR